MHENQRADEVRNLRLAAAQVAQQFHGFRFAPGITALMGGIRNRAPGKTSFKALAPARRDA